VLVERRGEGRGRGTRTARGRGVGKDRDVVEVFSDALAVSGPSSLEASTESFVDVARLDSLERSAEAAASPGHQQWRREWEEGEESGKSEGEGGSEREGEPSEGEDPGEGWSGNEAARGQSRASGGAESQEQHARAVKAKSEKAAGERPSGASRVTGCGGGGIEWARLSELCPKHFKKCIFGNGEEPHGRVPGVAPHHAPWRGAHAQWLQFSRTTQFPEDEALLAVEEAEISNHEHLTPAQRTHAARLVSILERTLCTIRR